MLAGGHRCSETQPSGANVVHYGISMRFAFLTATSARPFDWGNTPRTCDDRRASILARKSAVAAGENSGPPSLDISPGTPNVANRALMAAIIGPEHRHVLYHEEL